MSAGAEANVAIAHLLQQGNCQEAGKAGHEMIRLVEPIPALEKTIESMRAIEEEARQEPIRRLGEGDWLGVEEVFPSGWKAQTVEALSQRLACAVEQAVLEELKRDPAYQVRTTEDESGQIGEEVRLAPVALPSTPESDDSTVNKTASDDVEAVRCRTEGKAEKAKAAKPLRKKLKVVFLPVKQLHPNPWNANRMTQEEKAELLQEERRLGRPPKPIVVRRTGDDTYEIVDGEHSWAAAVETGFTEVPCEVIEVDDFEAMRQSLKRNEHGKNDPVKLGRLYQRMMQAGQLSQRALGQEIGKTEGTVRNFLAYAEAAEVRNRYASQRSDGEPVNADEQVAGLTVKQVRAYLDLPEGRRDEWLGQGGGIDEANAIREEAGKNTTDSTDQVENRPAAPSARTARPRHSPAEEEPEENEDGDGADPGGDEEGEAGDQPEPAPVEEEEPAGPSNRGDAPQPAVAEEPSEPYSEAERVAVEGVLATYKAGRTLVRKKILAGLAAYPDAVTFFKRMINRGS